MNSFMIDNNNNSSPSTNHTTKFTHNRSASLIQAKRPESNQSGHTPEIPKSKVQQILSKAKVFEYSNFKKGADFQESATLAPVIRGVQTADKPVRSRSSSHQTSFGELSKAKLGK